MQKGYYKYYFFLFLLGFIGKKEALAQDPFFSQFYSSPLTINPALAGNGNADWRAVGNHKSQWITNGIEPITTAALSVDGKLLRQKNEGYNYIGGGINFIQDRALSGAYKSTSINLILSSYISLDEDDNQGLSIGLGTNYSNTYIDFNQLTFAEQLTPSGFNRTLPSNEVLLSGIKPYISVFAGINYNYATSQSYFNIGIASYRFMKSTRTALSDNSQVDPPRLNLQADYETYLNKRLVINTNALFVMEKNVHSYIAGFNFGNIVDDKEYPTVINTGLWIKDGSVLIPSVGLSFGRVKAGLTYDINLPSSNDALNSIKTYEFSLSYSGLLHGNKNAIPCPWR